MEAWVKEGEVAMSRAQGYGKGRQVAGAAKHSRGIRRSRVLVNVGGQVEMCVSAYLMGHAGVWAVEHLYWDWGQVGICSSASDNANNERRWGVLSVEIWQYLSDMSFQLLELGLRALGCEPVEMSHL